MCVCVCVCVRGEERGGGGVGGGGMVNLWREREGECARGETGGE